jgi:hypothetical protein
MYRRRATQYALKPMSTFRQRLTRVGYRHLSAGALRNLRAVRTSRRQALASTSDNLAIVRALANSRLVQTLSLSCFRIESNYQFYHEAQEGLDKPI